MKTVLSIAGSDSGGGAGIQADIKSACYHNVFMSTALTAITAQNTLGVQGAVALEPSFVVEQMESVLSDFDVSCIKIGMLSNKDIIEAVAKKLSTLDTKIVFDPVAISRAGSKLLDDDSIDALKSLFELSYLITPNSYEAKLFFGVQSLEDVEKLPSSKSNILFKNIGQDSNSCVDILLTNKGEIMEFETPKVQSSNTHGTGCSYSASIACLLAQGYNLNEAISGAKEYIYKALNESLDLGKGNGPINHMLNS